MKITFIGTSAGEGYPGLWCECPNCTKARRLGGRNLRGNSSILIDDDFLIDMNANFAFMAPRLGIQPSKIHTLLVTHTHMDHFTPEWLWTRSMSPKLAHLSEKEQQNYISPCFTQLPMLNIYGNIYAEKALYAAPNVMENPNTRVAFHLIEDGVPHTVAGLTFTPIRAHHGGSDSFCFNYIIERNNITLLYASDTGGYDTDTMDILLSHRYDCIVMEGTFGNGANDVNHMSLAKNREMLRIFENNHVWKNGVNFYLTHLCPHWTPPHDEYAAMMRNEGIEVAYDGKIIDL